MKVVEAPLVIVAGCTGTGKSDLGVRIAQHFGGEIISADSMQIYKGLDIVTNKITEKEMMGVPHHLISFLEPNSDYNVHQFQRDTLRLIDEIRSRNKLPIVVGGTAYYIESVIYEDTLIDVGCKEKNIDAFREELQKKSASDLYAQLQKIDPESAKLVHPNSKFRVLRALEIYLLSGQKKSELKPSQTRLRFPNTCLFILDALTTVLDNRLDNRVEVMQSKGLIEELNDYYNKYKNVLGTHGVQQSIGIKEFAPFLKLSSEEKNSMEGEKILKFCYDNLKLHTRQYSRKQRKWMIQRFLKKKAIREVPNMMVLDTSKNFDCGVVPYAIDRVKEFLQDGQVKIVQSPCLMNSKHNDIEDVDYSTKSNLITRCEICDLIIHGELSYKAHIAGRKHKKLFKKLQREDLHNLQ